jgi:hypothetical protein
MLRIKDAAFLSQPPIERFGKAVGLSLPVLECSLTLSILSNGSLTLASLPPHRLNELV